MPFRTKPDNVRSGLLRLMRDRDFAATERALASRSLGQLGDLRQEALTVAAMEICPVPASDPLVMGSPAFSARPAGPHHSSPKVTEQVCRVPDVRMRGKPCLGGGVAYLGSLTWSIGLILEHGDSSRGSPPFVGMSPNECGDSTTSSPGMR